MSKLGRQRVQILSWLLQNVNLQRQVQRDQQRFDCRQEFTFGYLSRIYSNKRGRLAYTMFTSCQNAACSHKFFPLLGRLCSGRFYILTRHFHWANVILAACFTLRGHGVHIDLLWFLSLVGRICPLMQEDFLWPLLNRKAFYCRWIRVLLFSKVPSGSE